MVLSYFLIIMASMPKPMLLKKQCWLTFPESMATDFFFLMISIDFNTHLGMSRLEASPLPDPTGIMPSLIVVLTSLEAISLIVPSPPQATIISGCCAMACSASAIACFLYWE
ncbi:hypothetical protein D9M69_663560 [compost metagenome]